VTHSTSPLPEFAARHLGPRDEDVAAMLDVIGQPDLEALVAATLPARLRDTHRLAIEPSDSEQAMLAELRSIAAQNVVKTSLIGLGYHQTVIPPVIQRNILVHALSAGNLAGPLGGAAQLPDDGRRSDRPRHRQCLAAR